MRQRDENGKRIKWTKAEKEMVKEMKSIGLEPCKPILSYRFKAERLGKTTARESMNATTSLPPDMTKKPLMPSKVRSVIVVPSEARPSEQNTAKEEGIDLWQPAFHQVYEGPFFPLPEVLAEAAYDSMRTYLPRTK